MTQEVLKLALEALEGLIKKTSGQAIYSFMETERRIAMSACVGIKEALREHAMREVQRLGQEIEQEPVAYWKEHAQGLQRDYDSLLADFQAQRKPLTDEEIMEKFNKAKGAVWISDFARDIEAAHGIRE